MTQAPGEPQAASGNGPQRSGRERWWKANYQVVLHGLVAPVRFGLRFNTRSEGEIPSTRPLLLVPVHRSSIDMYAIAHSIGEFISYVSTDSFGHGRMANSIQRFITAALGSIVWKQSGIANRRTRAVALSRDIEDRLDRRNIVAVFTQGRYQPDSVDSHEDSVLGLVQRYQSKYRRRTGESLQIPIVPIGLEYDRHGGGMVQSKLADRLARFIPGFPRWHVPAMGSDITVRFGSPRYLDGTTPAELTRSVMAEAAALSNIPYRVPAPD